VARSTGDRVAQGANSTKLTSHVSRASGMLAGGDGASALIVRGPGQSARGRDRAGRSGAAALAVRDAGDQGTSWLLDASKKPKGCRSLSGAESHLFGVAAVH